MNRNKDPMVMVPYDEYNQLIKTKENHDKKIRKKKGLSYYYHNSGHAETIYFDNEEDFNKILDGFRFIVEDCISSYEYLNEKKPTKQKLMDKILTVFNNKVD